MSRARRTNEVNNKKFRPLFYLYRATGSDVMQREEKKKPGSECLKEAAGQLVYLCTFAVSLKSHELTRKHLRIEGNKTVLFHQ